MLGVVEIAVQGVALLANVAPFARVDSVAAAVLILVVLWIAYAGALNFEIWRLN